MHPLVYCLMGFIGGASSTFFVIRSKDRGKTDAFSETSVGRNTNTFRTAIDKASLSNKIHKAGYVYYKEKSNTSNIEPIIEKTPLVVSNDLDVSQGDVQFISSEQFDQFKAMGLPILEVEYDENLGGLYWTNLYRFDNSKAPVESAIDMFGNLLPDIFTSESKDDRYVVNHTHQWLIHVTIV